MVIPAEAGIQSFQGILDSRFRGSDGSSGFSAAKAASLPVMIEKVWTPECSYWIQGHHAEGTMGNKRVNASPFHHLLKWFAQ
jgi:hypothetical protein